MPFKSDPHKFDTSLIRCMSAAGKPSDVIKERARNNPTTTVISNRNLWSATSEIVSLIDIAVEKDQAYDMDEITWTIYFDKHD